MAGQALRVVVRLVLARLLAPEAFGLVAMAVVVTAFCAQLADLGLGPALVQRAKLTEEHRSTAFWSAGAIGLALCALFFVGAPLVGAFYGSTEVVPVVRALGLGLVLGFPERTYSYLFERRLSFRLIAVRRLTGIALGGVAGVGLALGGAGVWALVAERLVRTSTGSVLFMMSSDWRPSRRVSKTALADLWSYSRSIVGYRVVNFFNRNLDNLLIGRYLGATPLGLYTLAYQGVLLPLTQIARPIASVGFPAFAAIQHDLDRCRRVYLSGLRVSLLVATPLPLLAIFLGPAGIPLVLGEAWRPAVVPFQILSAVALIQIAMSLTPALFDGLGRADLSFKWTLVALAANSIGMVAGLRWGITGVAWGYFAAVAVTSPLQFAMAARLVAIRLRDLAEVLGRMLVALLATSIAPASILWWARLDPALELAAVGTAILLGFVFFTRLLAAESWALLQRSKASLGAAPAGGYDG